MKTNSIKYLHQLETKIESLRTELGVSAKGEAIFQAPKTNWSEKDVVVEADGNGGAILLIVQGNYPADYTIYKQDAFKSEDEACEKAEQLCMSGKAI